MCRIIFPSGVICVRDVVYAAYVRRTSLQICPRFFLGVHHSVQRAQYPAYVLSGYKGIYFGGLAAGVS